MALVAPALLTALAAAAAAGAWRIGVGEMHNPGPGFMPFATASLLGLMALGLLVRALARDRGETATRDGGRPVGSPRTRWGALVIVLGAVVGFGVAIDTAGFMVSAFLMLALLLGAVAQRPWWMTLLAAALVASIARVVFKALGMQFPDGPLGP